MNDITSLRGPVEMLEGKFVLLIPLEAGGDQFIDCARGIGEVLGEYLMITLPDSIVGMLRVNEGSMVSVDNHNGKLNIRALNPLPIN